MEKAGSGARYVVRADFFGEIQSNEQKFFWLPINRGTLFLSGQKVHYREFSALADNIALDFRLIIKVKMVTLNPMKNLWARNPIGSPFYLMFWNPFWNRYLVNFTYLAADGCPREVFFKFKTKKITLETMKILKQMLSDSVVLDPVV